MVDAAGRSRTEVVGRCKIEARPMVLVEAQTADGQTVSTMLQNAETVRLVGPAVGGGSQQAWQALSVSQLTAGDKVRGGLYRPRSVFVGEGSSCLASALTHLFFHRDGFAWETVGRAICVQPHKSVLQLLPQSCALDARSGSVHHACCTEISLHCPSCLQVYLLQQEGARHTGIAIKERINEL